MAGRGPKSLFLAPIIGFLATIFVAFSAISEPSENVQRCIEIILQMDKELPPEGELNGATDLTPSGIFSEYKDIYNVIKSPHGNWSIILYVNTKDEIVPVIMNLKDLKLKDGTELPAFQQVGLRVDRKLTRPMPAPWLGRDDTTGKVKTIIPAKRLRYYFAEDGIVYGVLDRRDAQNRIVKDLYFWNAFTGQRIRRLEGTSLEAFAINPLNNRYVEVYKGSGKNARVAVHNLNDMLAGQKQPRKGVHTLNLKSGEMILDAHVRRNTVTVATVRENALFDIDFLKDYELRFYQLSLNETRPRFKKSAPIPLKPYGSKKPSNARSRLESVLTGVVNYARFSSDGQYLYMTVPVEVMSSSSIDELVTHAIDLTDFDNIFTPEVPEDLRHGRVPYLYAFDMEAIGNTEVLRAKIPEDHPEQKKTKDARRFIYFMWGKLLKLDADLHVYTSDICTSNRLLALLMKPTTVIDHGPDPDEVIDEDPYIDILGLYQQKPLYRMKLEGVDPEEVVLSWVSHDTLLVRTKAGDTLKAIQVDPTEVQINNTEIRIIHEAYELLKDFKDLFDNNKRRIQANKERAIVGPRMTESEEKELERLADRIVNLLGKLNGNRLTDERLKEVYQNFFQNRLGTWADFNDILRDNDHEQDLEDTPAVGVVGDAEG